MQRRPKYTERQIDAYKEGRIAAQHQGSRICPNYPTFEEKAAWRHGFDDQDFTRAKGYDIAMRGLFERRRAQDQ